MALDDTKELILFVCIFKIVWGLGLSISSAFQGAFINMKLIIGNRESGTGSLFLI